MRIPWLQEHDTSLRFATNTITFDFPFCHQHWATSRTHAQAEGITCKFAEPDNCPNKMAMIGAAAFISIASKRQVTIFAIALKALNKSLDTIELVIDIGTIVPREYLEFLHLFSEPVGSLLPPGRKYDHTISRRKGRIPFRPTIWHVPLGTPSLDKVHGREPLKTVHQIKLLRCLSSHTPLNEVRPVSSNLCQRLGHQQTVNTKPLTAASHPGNTCLARKSQVVHQARPPFRILPHLHRSRRRLQDSIQDPIWPT